MKRSYVQLCSIQVVMSSFAVHFWHSALLWNSRGALNDERKNSKSLKRDAESLLARAKHETTILLFHS